MVGKVLSLRLCLVAVKRFPENTYFPEMLISGKGKCFHVFGCISKNFLENIFWCLEKMKENTNPEKIINDRDLAGAISRSTATARSRDRRRGQDRDRRIARSRSTLHEIAPSIAVVRLELARSARRDLGSLSLSDLGSLFSFSLSLSLSLSFRK